MQKQLNNSPPATSINTPNECVGENEYLIFKANIIRIHCVCYLCILHFVFL